MLKLNPKPTFKVSINLTVPGEASPSVIELTVRHKTMKNLQVWFKDNESRPPSESFMELIDGWSGVEDEDGNPVVFEISALASMLENYPTSANEIVAGYITGLTASRSKN